MDLHKTVSVSRTYAPNEYAVYLSPRDREQLEGFEDELRGELSGHLLEHARRERLELLTQPVIEFETDENLRLGEFGIQARLVRAGDAERAPEQAERGHTMIYSTAERVAGPVDDAGAPHRGTPLLMVDGKRVVVGPSGATIGRSRDCDIVLDDTGISRRHAEISPGAQGWTIADLGSTNGVRLNGRALRAAQPLHTGDRVELGSTEIVFELG
jgi:predicted component of type VI protein secretion system